MVCTLLLLSLINTQTAVSPLEWLRHSAIKVVDEIKDTSLEVIFARTARTQEPTYAQGYSVSRSSEVQLREILHLSQIEMKAYSLDLRQKIIDIYLEGKISQRQLAKQFRVALSFVEKLLKQYRETGSIAPKVRQQQTPTKLNQEQLNILAAVVSDNNDATLDEVRRLLEQKTGVLIGRSTLDRMLRLLNLSLKKNITPHRERE